MITLPHMGTPKRKGRPAGRTKFFRSMRMPQRFAEVLDVLAKQHETTWPLEAKRLIREGLERAGLWPPPEPDRPPLG